ncbi:MAG: C39 family peptidase [Patescibacteria group bacterium]|jgi:uncharacterized protein YvpB
MKKILVIVIAVAGIVLGALYYLNSRKTPTAPVATATPTVIPSASVTPSTTSTPTPTPTSASTPTATPSKVSSIKLDVPFISQAPLLVWDALHEDACEEASLIMVLHYLDKTKISSANAAEDEIQSMIKYEESVGLEKSITISQLADVAKHYGITNTKVKEDATAADLKNELTQNHVVILPAAGRELHNPHFTAPGPIYHMLVLTGFDQTGFITNDPGTKYGEDYRYTFDVLINAIHDWDPADIENGAKNYLIFE